MIIIMIMMIMIMIMMDRCISLVSYRMELLSLGNDEKLLRERYEV